jgi:hypothetical protein
MIRPENVTTFVAGEKRVPHGFLKVKQIWEEISLGQFRSRRFLYSLHCGIAADVLGMQRSHPRNDV